MLGVQQPGLTGLGTTSGSTGDAAGEMGDDLPIVDLGSNRSAMQVSVGSYHACALLDDLSIACWGHNGHGQIGIGTNGRRRHPGRARSGAPGDGPADTAASHWVSSGSYYTCAIIDDGTVRCWGENSYGELGIEGTDDG